MGHLDSRLRLLVLVPLLAACQVLGPALSSAIVAFGQDLLSTAAFNYRPQYAESLSNLLLAMAETTTGMQFTALPEDYYDRRIAELEAQREAAQYRTQQETYASDPYGQSAYEHDPYAQAGYEQDTYADSQSAYGQNPDEVYDRIGSQPEPGGQYVYGADSAPYQALRSPSGTAGADVLEPLSLDVALLAQSARPDGSVGLQEVTDGDVLRDGGGDPAAGDKIKISFRASCACHLYVIGVDATGWVTKIHPAPGEPVLSLAAERNYLVPSGDTWWGLDQYKGVEQIYFLLSRNRRPDIEAALAAFPDERPHVPAGYRGVREPAVVPVRGLVQVQSPAPAVVPTATGRTQVRPASFAASLDTADLVVTRWFEHR